MPAFDYAPAPESRDVARLRASYGIFVDGQFRVGAGEAIKTVNPANEEPLAEVAEAGPADVADAVVRHLRRKIEALKVRIDVGRSYGAAVRAEIALGGGMEP